MSIFRCQFFPKAYQRERQSKSTQQQQSIWVGIDAMCILVAELHVKTSSGPTLTPYVKLTAQFLFFIGGNPFFCSILPQNPVYIKANQCLKVAALFSRTKNVE